MNVYCRRKCRCWVLAVSVASVLLASVDVALAEPNSSRPPQLGQFWTQLGARDAAIAHQATNRFTQMGNEAVAFLAGQLDLERADTRQIELLIAKLDDDQFSIREQASRELREIGEPAKPALRSALSTSTSPEVRYRSRCLLAEESPPLIRTPKTLRAIRAVEILEHIGTKEAEKILTRLANGIRDSTVAHHAKFALIRIQDRAQNSAGSRQSHSADDVQKAKHKCKLDPFCHVFDVSFSPNGQLIAAVGSTCDLGIVKLWDAVNCRELMSIEDRVSLLCVDFSPNSQLLAIGGGAVWSPTGEGIAGIWNVTTGRRVTAFTGHSSAVFSIAFSPDGKWVATGGYDKTLRIWSAETGREIHRINEHQGIIYDVEISPDGRYLASCGGEGHSSRQAGELKIWETATFTQVFSLDGHQGSVFSIDFSNDGRQLVSGSGDKSVKVWDLATGRVVTTLNGHTRYVHGVAFGPDGRIASAGLRGLIKYWDTAKGQPIDELPSPVLGQMYRLAFSPDGSSLVTAGPGTFVNLWSIPQRRIKP